MLLDTSLLRTSIRPYEPGREPVPRRRRRWEHTNVCSDGQASGAHPRGFGAFPRVLAWLERERGTLALEVVVSRMMSRAAEHVGLTERGRIAPGWHSDLVLFDPDTVGDRSSIAEPQRMATGIARVHGLSDQRTPATIGSRQTNE